MYLLELVVKNSHSHTSSVVHFKPGMNWLLGENESGKTELLDLLCYAITGNGLRLNISEYKSLYVSLVFRIKDSTYKVERGKSTNLYEVSTDGDKLTYKKTVTSKTAVNKYISEQLGYGYTVFASLNYSRQLDGVGLTAARNSDRLSLINKINGVDEANAFEKVLENQKKEFNNQIKALTAKNVVELVEWTKDNSLEPFATSAELEILSKKCTELYGKISLLNKMEVNFRTIPKEVVLETPPVLEHFSEKDVLHNISLLNSLLMSKRNSEASIAKAKETLDTFKDKTPSNLLPLETLTEFERIVSNNEAFYKQQKFLEEHQTTCPNCEHVFNDEGMTNPYTLQELPCSSSDYQVSKEFYKNVEQPLKNTKSSLEYSEIVLEKVLADLEKIPAFFKETSPEALQEQIQQYKDAIRSNENRKYSVETFLSLFKTPLENVEDCLKELPTLTKELEDKSLLKEKLHRYIPLKGMYEVACKTEEATAQEVKILKDKVAVIDKVLEKSKQTRLHIQNTCIPVLNTFASRLINKLTGGKRYGLTMNENFELSLDGKPIQAYSGSTVVLANVAFRLALVEMFYKKSFPVFIGDEIDAYADDNRAQHINDALARLEKEGYQMILVSHHALNFSGNKINLADVKNKG